MRFSDRLFLYAIMISLTEIRNTPASKSMSWVKPVLASARLNSTRVIDNLNIHFHILFLDGVYVQSDEGMLRFRQVAPPTTEELQVLLHCIAHRVARYLERQGLLERDVENSYLALENLSEDASAMPVWPQGPISVTSSSVCVGTLPVRRCPRSACHSPRMARSGTS